MNCCDEFGNCTQGPGCPVRCEKVMQTPLIQGNSDGTSPNMRVQSFPSLRQWAEDMGRSFVGSLGWVALFGVCIFVGVVALK